MNYELQLLINEHDDDDDVRQTVPETASGHRKGTVADCNKSCSSDYDQSSVTSPPYLGTGQVGGLRQIIVFGFQAS